MSPRNRPVLSLSATDAAKLERIWNEHAAIILGMLKTYCACPEDAHDALQELFLRVGKNPTVVDSAKSPRAFLIVSARRIAIDAARKRATDQRREESPEAAEFVHPSPASIKNDADLDAAISRALADLPPEQRSVFEAKVLHGKTLAVIAAEHSITLNTAASRLRYSLDKIRTRLRPHYEAMKNPTKQSQPLPDSSTRLIKPLEPKRVPSVVPGLEGVAAFAVADGHLDPINVHEPIVCVCEWEIPVTEPVDHPVHVDPVVPDPIDPVSFELSPESADHEHAPVDETSDGEVHDTTDDASSSASEVDASHIPSDESQDNKALLSEIFENNFTDAEGSVDHAEESGIDFTESVDHQVNTEIESGPFDPPMLAEFFTFQIDPHQPDGEASDSTDNQDISDFHETDFNEYLLSAYNDFLGEHPDWIETHAGGDIQSQVLTPSEYTGLEWENPGAAHSFDQWFHDTYIAPYEELNQTEGGSGDWHQVAMDGPTVFPKPWMRGGTIELSGDGIPTMFLSGGAASSASEAGAMHTDNLSHDISVPVSGDTSQTIVSVGRVDMANPFSGSFVVEGGHSFSIGDQVLAQGSYDSHAETHPSSSSHESHITESHGTTPIPFSVAPIVSGSNSPLGSEDGHDMSHSHDATPIVAVQTLSHEPADLPVLVHLHEIQHHENEADRDSGIIFLDDDTNVEAVASHPVDITTHVPVNASHDVAAAVGGAFVAGSATQISSPAKGLAPKRGLIA